MNRGHLLFQSIRKSFSGIAVLKEVTFELSPGQTLGLVGENGAGKSTLMNILGGNLLPDSGRMLLDGQAYTPSNPQDAAKCGLALVHQELNLFSNLSIAENLFLRAFPTRGWLGLGTIRREAMFARSRDLLTQVGLSLSPDTLVEKLSAGERQLVEIAKALSIEARIILLDEPTTSLSAQDTERLMGLMRRLRARGMSMIYISHNLADVLRVSDGLVVLRDGAVVASGPRTDFTMDQVVSAMVGRNIRQMFPPRAGRPSTEPTLEVQGVNQPGMVHEINFTLNRGEILGIAGLMGSGRSELARILFGLDPMQGGSIRLDGQPVEHLSPRQRIQLGLAFVTEDRHREGLCLEASIAENMALVSLPRFARNGFRWIDRTALSSSVQKMRDAVHLTRSAANEHPVKTLSGGNQQKVVLGKWLLARPGVFILDEPTRGIDVGAKVEVYDLINQLADDLAGIIVISSEIEELIGIADRILVMSQGRIRDEMRRSEFDRERILRSALHGQKSPSPAEPLTS